MDSIEPLISKQQVNMEMETRHPLNFRHDFNENVFLALDVGVLKLDLQNEVVYKNKVLISMEKRIKKTCEESPFVEKIIKMADTIRDSKKDIQHYQMYDKQLYRVYGLLNDEDGSILFLIDDRARSDDYDKLLRYKQQMESVSYLAAGFAHELRNPLSIIQGFIQLSGLTDNLGKYYNTILSEINRMNKIIDDFLSLSRKASKKTLFAPDAFFESVVDVIRSECLLQNIELKYSFEKSEQGIFVNRSMMVQVILNLLRNTIEAFMPEQLDKVFSIQGQALEKGYMVMVSDNGPGMDKAVLNQIGKPFFTTKDNGTGIGLPLCKKIIEDHDGKFDIESELGKGTTMTILLPYKNMESDLIKST